jgi:hypothetical protein
MSAAWADRQRRTNRLVRTVAEYVFQANTPSPEQLYGLCKLTWITASFRGDDAAYINSTKIPALAGVFDADYSQASLSNSAKII